MNPQSSNANVNSHDNAQKNYPLSVPTVLTPEELQESNASTITQQTLFPNQPQVNQVHNHLMPNIQQEQYDGQNLINQYQPSMQFQQPTFQNLINPSTLQHPALICNDPAQQLNPMQYQNKPM